MCFRKHDQRTSNIREKIRGGFWMKHQDTFYQLAMASVYTHDAHCDVSYS